MRANKKANARLTTQNLLQVLNLHNTDIQEEVDFHSEFQTIVPTEFLQKIAPANPHDPLLRQILPLKSERAHSPTESEDPVQDLRYQVLPGVIHRFKNRILLVISGACPIHCRYCFRRFFPYTNSHIQFKNWHIVMEYLRAKTDINEVILSGGDPLSLSNEKLNYLLQQLSSLRSIRRIRIHTRYPVVQATRIDDEFLHILQQCQRNLIIVIHCNHPNELDHTTELCLKRLSQYATLLNQSVLLKGINDNLEILVELSEKLFMCNVMPYYLNVLDPVRGSSHFALSLQACRSLYTQLKQSLPGYLVPRLVQDLGNSHSKEWLI